jgi:hypothetical protein
MSPESQCSDLLGELRLKAGQAELAAVDALHPLQAARIPIMLSIEDSVVNRVFE